MKRLFFILLLCSFLAQLKAQDGVVFKMQYMPDRTYKTTADLSVKVNTDVTGSRETIEKLKSEGITPPVDGNLAAGFTGEMKSGALAADKSIPMDMDFKITSISASANGKDFPIPPKLAEKDIKLKGRVSGDGKLQLEVSDEQRPVSDSLKARMQHILSLVQSEIRFPARALKPGDSFTDTIPIKIPGRNGSFVQVSATAVYKLVSISGGNAYFGVMPTFSVNYKMQDASVAVTGMGIGRLIYSIKDNFPVSRETTINIKFKVISAKANLDGTSTLSSHYACTINQ